MKPGQLVRMTDGREGTVVYNGLDGVGIVWGRRTVDVELILSANPLFENGKPKGYPDDLQPEAMLRAPYPSAELPCVGEKWKDWEPISSEEAA